MQTLKAPETLSLNSLLQQFDEDRRSFVEALQWFDSQRAKVEAIEAGYLEKFQAFEDYYQQAVAELDRLAAATQQDREEYQAQNQQQLDDLQAELAKMSKMAAGLRNEVHQWAEGLVQSVTKRQNDQFADLNRRWEERLATIDDLRQSRTDLRETLTELRVEHEALRRKVSELQQDQQREMALLDGAQATLRQDVTVLKRALAQQRWLSLAACALAGLALALPWLIR